MKFFQTFFLIFIFSIATIAVKAQCSICTKTAQQLGDGPASGLNTGILYLGAVPLLIIGYVGYRWWKTEKTQDQDK